MFVHTYLSHGLSLCPFKWWHGCCHIAVQRSYVRKWEMGKRPCLELHREVWKRSTRRLDWNIFLLSAIFIHSRQYHYWIHSRYNIKYFNCWVHMLNYRSPVKTEENQETLAIPDTRRRGFVPASGLMAAGKRMGVFLVSFCILVTASAGNVEFKHHNNTEMAEVLQQIHNR